ncbi:lysophospholipid acyltransferase family protein [Mycoplasmopsis arginini]|uniref:Lysophospholipid acyltransferase family protein n=1 Tax=Mycoplasmopsis arginini TaxID=2094 RepID=A0ABZ2AIT4_MYCAR|nr:lysophospholipid acyltransferase family protein [Mycoplasmopsis arginini]WVN21823.1 lysophospholipid acyltransferase family protein [Mycoplasmopsis arginini]VEU81836.1 1-acyl-sn-glycerol-3-phosphate acyltransferase [Mycoplasmopsis arginini]
MKLKVRKFFRFIPLIHNILKLKSKARRNRNMPEYYKASEKHFFVQKFGSNILKHLNIKVEVEGFENIPSGPCFLTPNHSTYLDPLIIVSALWNHGDGERRSREANFVAREEVKQKKTIYKISQLIDTYYIDTKKPREALAILKDFGQHVKKNQTCGVIFPEGTRTRDGKINNFNSGVFLTAQSTYIPLVPVTINNAANALDGNRNGELIVKVKFHPTIKPQQFQTLDKKDFANWVQQIVSKDYIEQVITSNETVKNEYTKRK